MERGGPFSIVFALCIAILVHFPSTSASGQPGDTCEMGGGVKGTCEDIGRCLQTGGVVRREGGQVNICSQEFSIIYVCCRRPHVIARELCDAWAQLWRSEDGRCGNDHPLIVGGKAAHIGEFPHAVRFGKKYRNTAINYDCGGTLISPHFVLTAAHCLFSYIKNPTLWVKLGEHDIEYDATAESTERLHQPLPNWLYDANDLMFDPTNETEAVVPVEQVIEVEREYINPSYRHRVYNYHDIALLRLKTPAKFTSRVLPACLPYQYPANDYLDHTLTAVGWGTTENHWRSQVLQKVEIPVIDRLSCSTTRANNKETPLGITEDMICAGDKDKDSCSGDSGGPLTTRRPRNSSSCEHTVVGVVSYGVGVGYLRCGLLGVYTRVSSYLDWITGYIAPNATGYIAEEKGVELKARQAPFNVTSDQNSSSTLHFTRQMNARVDSKSLDSESSPITQDDITVNTTPEGAIGYPTIPQRDFPIVFGDIF